MTSSSRVRLAREPRPAPHRFVVSPLGLALATLITTNCFGGDSDCNVDFDECKHDSDCGPGLVCDTQPFGLGLSCMPATECETSADCATGEDCTQRPPSEMVHPFEPASRSKKVCSCVASNCSSGPSSSSDASSSVSSSSSSGSGGLGGGGGSLEAGGSGGVAGAAGSTLGGGGAG